MVEIPFILQTTLDPQDRGETEERYMTALGEEDRGRVSPKLDFAITYGVPYRVYLSGALRNLIYETEKPRLIKIIEESLTPDKAIESIRDLKLRLEDHLAGTIPFNEAQQISCEQLGNRTIDERTERKIKIIEKRYGIKLVLYKFVDVIEGETVKINLVLSQETEEPPK